MGELEFSVLGAVIAALSALGAEIIRIKQAADKLAADMRERELRGADPLPGRRVRYPRGYLLTAALYAVVAGAAGGLAGPDVPWLVDVYVGVSLPSFVARLVQVAEPLLPGRILLDGDPGPRRDHATIDAIAAEPAEPYRRIRSDVYRRASSLYSYLSA